MTLDWGILLILTSFILSIAVNALVTGLIVFKIVKVSLEAKAFTTSGPGGSQLRHVIFIIIESGMALLAVQLARVILYIDSATCLVYILFIGINQMCNVIIRSVLFYFYLFY